VTLDLNWRGTVSYLRDCARLNASRIPDELASEEKTAMKENAFEKADRRTSVEALSWERRESFVENRFGIT
jgi:hypothetical protein